MKSGGLGCFTHLMRDKMLSLKKREKEKKKKDLYRLIVFSEWYQSLNPWGQCKEPHPPWDHELFSRMDTSTVFLVHLDEKARECRGNVSWLHVS